MAELLSHGNVAAHGIDPDRAWRSLARSVSLAAYWQPPRPEDRLAAEPAVVDALRHIARALLTDDTVRSWFAEPGATQWAVDWRSGDDAAPVPRDLPARLRRWRDETRADEHRASVDRPRDPRAAISGEWWSQPWNLVYSAPTRRHARELVEDFLGSEVATLIPVSGSGRICTIESAADWAALCRAYRLEVTASRRQDWYSVTGRDGRWVIPDWVQVAEKWDAARLTLSGYLGAAGRIVDLGDGAASVIAGWHPASTLWLTDRLRESDLDREEWTATDDVWEMTRALP